MKRNLSLQPLSRDHHQALLLCFKIRQGFAKGVDPVRIMDYAAWFHVEHLLPHFEIEETVLFPILGNGHEHVKKAVEEHRRLDALFKQQDNITVALEEIEELLESHVRFEERVLFNEIQNTASAEELKKVEEAHREEPFVENTRDMFWQD